MKKTSKKAKPLKKVKKKKPEKISKPEADIEDDVKEKADKFEEHGCEYLNESECEEELEDDGLDVDEVEREHFEEEKE